MNVKDWLIIKIAEETGLENELINCDELFENFDLDSLSSISIAFDIENKFKLDEINPTVFEEFNTINKLSEWIQVQI